MVTIPAGAAVLVDHDREVGSVPLHLAQQGVDVLATPGRTPAPASPRPASARARRGPSDSARAIMSLM